MLIEIKVSHFAIIENLHLHFKEGFNVISGETGSGKSVLLKSLSLLMGNKGSADIIRTGHSQAIVEGSFDISTRDDIKQKLENYGIELDEDTLVVRRVLSADKSKVYLNGQMSSLNILRDIVSPLVEVTGPASPLIELTGQHENKNLLSPSYHLDLLDRYAGVWELRTHYHEAYEKLKDIERELESFSENGRNHAQRLDYLEYQRNEISALELQPGEDEVIELQIKKLKGMSRLLQFVTSAENVLDQDDDSVLSRINSLLKKSTDISHLDPEMGLKVSQLEGAKEIIEDVLFSMRSHVDKMDADAENLEKLETKLNDLRKLQKKYGPTLNDILESLVKIENEINVLQNSEKRSTELEKEKIEIKKEMQKYANELHKRRNQGATKLQDLVNQELMDLNMKGVIFSVTIEKRETFTSSGQDFVEFMSQTSIKDQAKPLAKYSSGGELSRILLSLKKVIGRSDYPRTYLFDEVDTGVSGETAEKVGKKLNTIAQGQQVICVTHLPQVAAFGDHHYLIQKNMLKDSVQMSVEELSDKERIKEIARLISGEKITKTSLAHAEALLSSL
ncbi:MAG: DNA repair protein RecN [Bdellovibrionaceae bacterium]|nr:DNA repair protein RecN [Pseudobdellovibrionaceae bacterium]NUM57500.1 DNA repair protein RecN [Pseudobdellovibrionaceae bacterium]